MRRLKHTLKTRAGVFPLYQYRVRGHENSIAEMLRFDGGVVVGKILVRKALVWEEQLGDVYDYTVEAPRCTRQRWISLGFELIE